VPRSPWHVVPGLADLRAQGVRSLRPDLVPAITVAAVAVPASLGMAELAGLPVVVGLYATMLPLVGYALFGSSRQLVVGPEGTLAALTAVTVAPLAAGDPARYATLAAALGVVMGVVLILAGVLRLGFMADFFSKPVLLGYINGIALTIIASQIGKLLGISVSEADFFPIVWEVLGELGDTHRRTAILSVLLLALAFGLRRFVPRIPATLAVVVVAIVASELFDLERRGVAVVGDVDGGLPPLGFPDLRVGDVGDLLLPASAFALVAFADTIASARTYAIKNGYEIDPNRELAGLGGANLASGISGAFPVSASGSRTALNDATGGRTQFVGLMTAVVVALLALFATPIIEPLPKAALGVVVVLAALGLFNVSSIWRLRHVRVAEVALAVVAVVGVLVFGVLGGVAVAIALSIAVFVYRTVRPHDAVLGAVDDVDGYHDIERYELARTVPGLIVYRFDAPLFFANAEHFRQQVRRLVHAGEKPDWFMVNVEAFIYLDATAIDTLKQLQGELAGEGVILAFARLKGRQREIFAETGLTEQVGEAYFFPTVRAGVAAFQARDPLSGVPASSPG
jgi:sulfate permease, SulP family